MSDVDEVLEKLVTDQAFRTQLRDDPEAALGGYDLEEEDLAVLAATLDEGQGSDHGVEQRTSKSAFLTAVMGFSGSGGGGGADPDLVAPDDAEPDSATRSQCKNDLKQIGIALHDDDPIQDLTPADGAEEAVEITYPGVYVQETPSPETEAVPPDASLSGEEDEQPVADGWPVKWFVPESSEPQSAPDADVASTEPPIDGETGPDDPPDADEGPRDLVAAEEPEEANTPEAPQTDPPDLVAERQTEEAETVHAFLKANGTDMQGESSQPRDPDLVLDDAAGQQDADR